MTTKILKSTIRGQITLPKQWRESFPTDNYVSKIEGNTLVITPLLLSKAEEEEVLFDADRDNDGKGISPEDMIQALKKIKHG